MTRVPLSCPIGVPHGTVERFCLSPLDTVIPCVDRRRGGADSLRGPRRLKSDRPSDAVARLPTSPCWESGAQSSQPPPFWVTGALIDLGSGVRDPSYQSVLSEISSDLSCIRENGLLLGWCKKRRSPNTKKLTCHSRQLRLDFQKILLISIFWTFKGIILTFFYQEI